MEYNIQEIEKLKKLKKKPAPAHELPEENQEETNCLYNSISKLDLFEHVAVY